VGWGCALLAGFLLWANQALPWVALRSQSGLRIAYLALVLLGSALVYLGALWLSGLQWRQFLKR
jgi:putative peptidoglycan lipid II flippase